MSESREHGADPAGEGIDTAIERSAVPPWLFSELDRLLGLYAREQLHHALLLTGQPGLGKRILAGALARGLVCTAAFPERPCGQCRPCQLVAGGSHPDLRTLGPFKGGEIVVDGVRGLVDFLHLSAQRGGSRVAVIAPCDRLNRAAANSLLKSLEEPPDGVFLILVTGRPARLPPTVRSRCAVRSLSAPPASTATQWLEERTGYGPERIHRALALASGMPLRAEELLLHGGLEQFDALLQQAHRLAAGGDPVKEAEGWASHPAELAEGVAAMLAELIRWRHGVADRGLLPRGLGKQLRGVSSSEALHQAFLHMGEHRRDLEQPLNGRLAAEAIFLELRTALRGQHQRSL